MLEIADVIKLARASEVTALVPDPQRLHGQRWFASECREFGGEYSRTVKSMRFRLANEDIQTAEFPLVISSTYKYCIVSLSPSLEIRSTPRFGDHIIQG